MFKNHKLTCCNHVTLFIKELQLLPVGQWAVRVLKVQYSCCKHLSCCSFASHRCDLRHVHGFV
jgi:hypothetical protein